MCSVIEFACWAGVIALAAAFLLSLCVKWGWLERAQVAAPNDFFEKLLSCKFCCSFWVCAGLALVAASVTGCWALLAAPVCSTLITRELW